MTLVDVGGGVAQRTERIHRFQRLSAAPGHAAVHALRLVHNQNRAGCANEVYRLFAPRSFILLVDGIDVGLVDGADSHHHYLDVRAGGEGANPPHPRGIVYEMVERRARVERAKVVAHHLQRLVDALFDGYGRHDYDELGEAVPLVQLEYRPQIDVSLAGSGFHLHREIQGFQRFRRAQAVSQLRLSQVFQNLVLRQIQRVGYAQLVFREPQLRLVFGGGAGGGAYGEFAAPRFLPAKQVADSGNRVHLVIQIRFELKLHRAAP